MIIIVLYLTYFCYCLLYNVIVVMMSTIPSLFIASYILHVRVIMSDDKNVLMTNNIDDKVVSVLLLVVVFITSSDCY